MEVKTKEELFADLVGGKEPTVPTTSKEPAPVETGAPVDESKTETVDGKENSGVKPEKPVSEEQPVELEDKPSVESPDISALTDGKFSSIDELVSGYQELLKEKPTTPAKNPFEDEEFVGKMKSYFESQSVDYSSMSPEHILKLNMREDFKDLLDKGEMTESQFDRLFQKSLEQDYGITGDEEDDELGLFKMRAKAEKVRGQLIAKQKEAQMPEWEFTTEGASVTQGPSEEEVRKLNEFISGHEATQSLLKAKVLSVKFGDADPYNIEVDNPSDLIEAVKNYGQINQWVIDKQGNVDMPRLLKGLAYLRDPQGVERALIAYGKNLGKEGTLDLLENPSKPPTSTAPKKINTGDVKTNFLREALKAQGKNADF